MFKNSVNVFRNKFLRFFYSKLVLLKFSAAGQNWVNFQPVGLLDDAMDGAGGPQAAHAPPPLIELDSSSDDDLEIGDD